MTGTLLSSKLPCPTCGSSDAWHVYDDGDGRLHSFCFSCSTWFGDSKTRANYEGVDNRVDEAPTTTSVKSPLKIFLSEIENST
jgi:hypothetical protein